MPHGYRNAKARETDPTSRNTAFPAGAACVLPSTRAARLEARPSQKRPQDLRALPCALPCAPHLRAFFAAGAPLAAPLAASPDGCAGSKLRVPSHTVVQAPPSRVLEAENANLKARAR